ncbi:NAD(P)H-hydrate dehydratase [Flectobacillus sp. BAB-3569]|uniref:NAD(P)H-hydrate dehydratase n=1 Tax=Flectobacillus sp. BAB-3569 TaxID=1509483 RepID=UPI000BA2C70A|nr:NAD(P)H-hydrate dehydratase [Flectobacillus sp. BAB-3569]PAC32853.1 bifunctional ADP-dependent NAD(P)H-hydrate dehydratase/NAD(P)H-hydrate epimerase [Flectobacillus sp. BAB-3569]
MRKIFDTQQIRNWDAYTIAQEPIASIDLMERASIAFTDRLLSLFSDKDFTIFCGKGNNGGDGLAIARMLVAMNRKVEVYVVDYSAQASPDFVVNYDRLTSLTTIHPIKSLKDFPVIGQNCVVVDAILGSGTNRPVEGILKDVIQEINQSKLPVISVDIASGLYVSQPIARGNTIIQPDYTLTFEAPKLAFLMPQNQLYVGEWECLPIGLSKEYVQNTSTSFFWTDMVSLKKRAKFSHKGTFGHALLAVGSYGSIGAAVLSAKACLRSGVGLLTTYIPACGYEIMQASVPEAMCQTDPAEKELSVCPDLEKYTVIGIGCGLGKSEKTKAFLKVLLRQVKSPLVLDADALNIMAEEADMLALIPAKSVLTPHPKELQRLIGSWENDFEKLEKVKVFSQKYNCIVLVKGMHTAVVLPNQEVHFNSTGNPGMATGGSGDVLTGIITALIAQGYSSEEAAIIGVFKHGEAGDMAAQERGQMAMLPSDIIEKLRW